MDIESLVRNIGNEDNEGPELILRLLDVVDRLPNAAHTLETAIRFARHGLIPSEEEVADWRATLAELRASLDASGVMACRAEQRGPKEWVCDCAAMRADCKPNAAAGVKGCALVGSGECDCAGLCQRVKDGYAADGADVPGEKT